MTPRVLAVVAIIFLAPSLFPILFWSVVSVIAPFQSSLQKLWLIFSCAIFCWGALISWELTKHYWFHIHPPFKTTKAWLGLICLAIGAIALEVSVGGDQKGIAPRGLILSALISTGFYSLLLMRKPNNQVEMDASPQSGSRLSP